MTRKTKIGWTVGGIAFAVAASCVFSGEEKGEMKILYAGLASNDSRYVSFTISNSFHDEMFCDYETFEFVHGNWHLGNGGKCYNIGFIPTGCTTNFTVPVPGTNSWRVTLYFTKAWPDNFISDARRALMEFTFQHGWSALEELSKIGYTWHSRHSPEMLGHKPLVEAQK